MSEFTLEEVAKHGTPTDCWLAIDGHVYDVTKFLKMHPGGAGILKQFAGQEVSEKFFEMHRSEVLTKYKKLRIGTVKGEKAGAAQATADFSELCAAPYSEPSAWQGWYIPYYSESHRTFRAKLRKFIDAEIMPEALASEDDGEIPSQDIYKAMGRSGLLISRVGKDAMPFCKAAGIELEKELGVKPEEFDSFHELIAHEEMGRLGCPGFCDGLGAGFCIGAPPVLHFCQPSVRDVVLPQVLRGEKRICLAISEPAAGSDVAGMLTVGNKAKDGSHYALNGIKKWITNGMFADYFVVACHTGIGDKGPTGGHKDMSMVLASRDMGIETKNIKTAYGSSAGTALVLFDDVKVPKENLMGLGGKPTEGQGFGLVMYNFNHERWFICAQYLAANRLVFGDCFKWATQRKAFGKTLMDQPVIRMKFANMAGVIESCHTMIESVTHQMNTMPYAEQSLKLGGPIALLKYQVTRAGTLVADEATQIFGGRGITRTGMGRVTERFLRSFKYASILGGSEEVMADLAIRWQGQALGPRGIHISQA